MTDFVNNPRDVEAHIESLKKSCDDLDSICDNCGGCCCAEVATKSVNGNYIGVVVDELPCKHMIKKSNGESSCGCYEDRFEETDYCLDLFSAMVKGALVSSCPYVEDFDGYVGKKILNTQDYMTIRPELIRAIRNNLDLVKSLGAFDDDDLESFVGADLG